MNFRTTFTIKPSEDRISYLTPVLFTGSCFASEIGRMMEKGKMNAMVNPSGTVYNPVSVMNSLDMIIQRRLFAESDLYNYKGTYMSFLHYTSFDSDDPLKVISKINESAALAADFLEKAGFLFVTLGTARVYRLKETGEIVSNCHKVPASCFLNELLTVEEIVAGWNELLGRLNNFNKNLKVVFTVSPVRHWKDGAHGNQVSKSVLFLAIEKLLVHPSVSGYFPAYELLMDDLRDYRFYDTDMLHPSDAATDYIWKAFAGCYFDRETFGLWTKISAVTTAMNHRFISGSGTAKKIFARRMLDQISDISSSNRDLDFTREIDWFRGIADYA